MATTPRRFPGDLPRRILDPWFSDMAVYTSTKDNVTWISNRWLQNERYVGFGMAGLIFSSGNEGGNGPSRREALRHDEVDSRVMLGIDAASGLCAATSGQSTGPESTGSAPAVQGRRVAGGLLNMSLLTSAHALDSQSRRATGDQLVRIIGSDAPDRLVPMVAALGNGGPQRQSNRSPARRSSSVSHGSLDGRCRIAEATLSGTTMNSGFHSCPVARSAKPLAAKPGTGSRWRSDSRQHAPLRRARGPTAGRVKLGMTKPLPWVGRRTRWSAATQASRGIDGFGTRTASS